MISPGRRLPRFSYHGRARTLGRRTGRALADLSTPALHPQAPIVRAYWWEAKKNFGDLLTPVILRRLGVLAVRAEIDSAQVVGVGSLLQQLPQEFSGVLWGTGQIADEPLDLPGVRAVALRGELTRERLGGPAVIALGDPGLLVRRFVSPRRKRFDLGVVVHFSHEADGELTAIPREGAGRVRFIGVRRRPLAVAADVAECRTILTSSLHGLIMADAFGIPALWVRTSTPLYGHDFKFWDHETVARPAAGRGVDLADLSSLAEVSRRAVLADDAAIERACTDLTASVGPLVEAVAAPRVSPWSLPALRG
jgi:hypothetical protein